MAANIKLTISSNFDEASADFKQFGQLTEAEAKRAEAALKKIDGEQMDKFTRSTKMATTAIKATRGPTAALQAEYYKLRNQIEKMIKNGVDPMDDKLADLRKQYAKLDDQLEKTRKEEKKLQQQQEQHTKMMGALKVAAVAAGAAIAREFLRVSAESAELASAAEESLSKFNVVFADSAGEMEDWADELSKTLGRSRSDIIKMTASTGDLLKPLGFAKDDVDALSKSFTELALDLGSFNDVDPSDVLRDMNAAITGSPETMKKYGVVINETVLKQEALNSGMIETIRTLTAQEKAQATYQLILKGTVDAQGDLLRTQESTANVSRRLEDATKDLKIAYGQMVNESMTPLKAILADVTSSFAASLTQAAALKTTLRDLNDGSLDADMSLEQLNAQLEKLEKLNRSASGQGRFRDEIEALRTVIDSYGMKDMFLTKEQEQQAALARLEAERKQKEEERIALEQSASKELEVIRQAQLSDEEKQLQKLQEQIDYWAQYRDINGAQELLNSLISERNQLLEEQKAKEDALKENEKTQEEQQAEYNITPYEQFLEMKFQMENEYAERSIAVIDSVTEAEKNAQAERKALLKVGLQTSSDFFGSMSDLLYAFGEDNKAAVAVARTLAATQAAINSYLAFTEALASVPYPFNFVAAASVLAAGLAQQANIWSAETGGSFTVPSNPSSSRGDSQTIAVNPGEEVNVTPRGETGGKQIIVNIMNDREVIRTIVQDLNDSGELTITSDNIRGGVA